MIIKLPLEKIKDFLTFASDIQSDKSGIQPILKYIKFEIVFGECLVTKYNFEGYVQYSFDSDEEDCEFIIPEKDLIDFCSVSNEPYIIIEFGNKNIHIIKNKESKKCYSVKYNDGGYKVIDFPKLPVENSQQFTEAKLDKNILLAIQMAKPYTGSDELLPQLTSIYIDSNYIYAYGGSACYLSKINETLPKIAFSKKETQILSKFDTVDFCVANELGWNIYKYRNVVYGFRKQEGAVGFDYNLFVSKSKRDLPYFNIKTDDLVAFCTSVKNYCNSNDKTRTNAKWKNSNLKLEDGLINLSFDVAEVNEGVSLVCDTTGTLQECDFSFNQTLCTDIFKSLPYNEIFISDAGNMFIIYNEQDKNFIGFISKVQPQNIG